MDPSAYVVFSQNFQSILAFPFWLFNANNYGNTALQVQQIIPVLPVEFYTEASIVAPYIKIKFDWGMFIIFLVLQGLAISFVWAVLLWVWFAVKGLPATSSYPLFDFAFKAKAEIEVDQQDVLNAGDLDVINMVRDVKIFVKME
jgi:hypothetical protein